MPLRPALCPLRPALCPLRPALCPGRERTQINFAGHMGPLQDMKFLRPALCPSRPALCPGHKKDTKAYRQKHGISPEH